MIRLGFAIFTILFLSLFISAALNIKIGRSISLSYVILAFLMFFMSMFTKISNFKYLVAIVDILMLIYLTVQVKNKKFDIGKFKDLCLRPSLFIFVIFFVYLYFVTSNIQLSNIDDLGYWGTRVLDINRTDALYTNEYTVYGHYSYPPFTALIEIVLVKLLGTFKQSYLILAQASFSFSLLLSLFDKYESKIKDVVKVLIVFVIAISLTLMVQNNQSFYDYAFIYNSIYVDWLMGLILGKCMSLYYDFKKEEISSYLELGLFESALILIKPTAIPLVVLIAVTGYVYLALRNEKLLLDKYELKNYLLYIFGLPALFYAVWKIYFRIYNSSKSQITSTMLLALISAVLFATIVVVLCEIIYKKHKDKINLKMVFGIILFLPVVIYGALLVLNPTMFNGNDNYYISIAVRFIHAYFSSSIFEHPFKISYYFINLFITLLLVIYGHNKKKGNEYYSIPVLFYLGSIGYALMIMLSYMFVFDYEGYSIVVFGRYMQTYTLAGITLLILIVMNESLSYKKLSAITIASLLFVEPNSLSTLVYNKNWQNYRTEAQIQAIDDYFEYEYNCEKIAVFVQYDMRDISLIGYLADEKKENITFYASISKDDEDRFNSAIKDNEYVLICSRDDALMKFWSEYSDDEPYNMSLYKINHDNGSITIELIRSWDDLK